ncbi:MAG: hypothetical protein RMJ59_08045 [Candidatus Nitrosocaldus sp.]|nr:hypothetical protein [Candidatus Nitrosocaldus sp.]
MSEASNTRMSKRMLSIGLAAIMVLSSIVVVLPVQAQQQQVTITASTDERGNRFFGPSLARVLITDRSLAGSPADEINVTVEARRGTTSLGQASVPVAEIGTSGQFELYVAAHTDALPANPTQADVDNVSIMRIYSSPATNTQTTQIGGGADDSTPVIRGISTALQSGDVIVITYGGQSKEIRFDRSTAVLTTDRTTAGHQNRIILRLNDQDANVDPTRVDEFDASTANLISPTVTFAAGAKWRETGQNTGIFELVVGVNVSVSGGAQLTVATFPSSATFTVQDHDVYAVYTDSKAPYNATTSTASTSTQSVSLRNVNGRIELAVPPTLGNGFQIRITDADRNIDTTARDTFNANIFGTGTVPFKETDNNTGIFLPDLSDNKVAIVPAAATGFNNTTKQFEVSVSDIAADTDITLTYTDPARDPSGTGNFNIVAKIQHVAGNISTTTPTVSVTGRAIIEINDMDLNLNPNGRDFYTVTFNTADSATENNAADFRGLADLRIKVRGSGANFTSPNLVIGFEETDANSGIFRGEVRISVINTVASLADGDRITFEYIDNTESPTITRSVDVRIGKPSGVIELDRTSYPPSTNLTGVGDRVTKIHVVIVDPSFNTSSGSQDVLTLKDADNTFENGELRMQLIKGATTLTIQPGFLKTDGTAFTVVPAGVSFPTTASEDGVNTGRFTVDIDLPRTIDGNTINDGWQLRLIYKDSNGDEQTITASIVQNTAVITTDKSTYDLGSTIILQIRESDWNNDSDKVDEIPITIGDFRVDSDKVTDDTLAQIGAIQGITLDPSNVLRETDKNSGIFQIRIQNINAELVSRGKNLEFTYTDKTPSGGGLEQEVKLTVLITATQPEIIFDKEVYTPFDRMCIRIIDPGANSDSDRKELLSAVGNARLRIIVGGTSADYTNQFEETEPNSGVFQFRTSPNCVAITDVNANARPGDGIRVEYRTADRQAELSKTARIAFNDGTVSFDKDSYRIGETARITIDDADENRNPDVPDQFSMKVVSDSDPAGIRVTVRETGDRTGRFTVDIILTSEVSSGNRLQVREGDQITAIYTDETLPGAQTINQQLVNRDNTQGLRTLQTRDVAATATIGITVAPTERFAVQQPRTVDQAGNPTTPTVNVPVSIATQIKNNTTRAMDYVYIVQVKDANGVVVSISTVSSTLDGGRTANVSASWMPTAPGTYTIETFVWSELGKPSPLSPLQRITVTVT